MMLPHSKTPLLNPSFSSRFILLALLGSLAGFGPQPLVAQQPATPEARTAPADSQKVTDVPLLDPGDVDPSIQTLKVAVRRVVVDVVVTDAKGQPVEGLTADDFKVFENGKPQAMRSFDAHIAKPEPPLPMPKLPPNTYTNIAMGPQGGPVTVILYDLLNTPLDAQPYAHEELLKFLKKRAVSGQVAIFVLGDKLHMLQGFTDNETALIAALNTTGPRQSGLLQGSGQSDLASQGSQDLTQTEGNQNGATDTSARGAGNDAAFTAVLGMLKHMETAESSYQIDRRVDITVDALDEIARFLIGLPGRKNLLWMSGSFPAGIIPNPDLNQRDSFEVTRNYNATMMRATDLLSLAHISVYPVDVRGLQGNPMFSAASTQTFEPGQGKDLKALRDFNTAQTSEHAAMDVIADQTGGHAFYNTNGLTEAATAAVQQGAVYYTMTYSPTDTRMDGGLRKVRVDLDKPGLQLAYRRSYFADNLDSRVDIAEDTPHDPLSLALEHGAPASHELFMEAQLQRYGDPVPATPGQMKVLAQYEAMTAHAKHNKVDPAKLAAMKPVMIQRYAVVYGLLTRQLTLDQGEDGLRHGTFDFAMMSYNDDGEKLNGVDSKVQDAISSQRYADMEEKGYRMIQVIPVPVQATSVRLAVRDAGSGHIGSLELHLPLTPVPRPTAAQTTPPAQPTAPAH